jgi:ferredoxin
MIKDKIGTTITEAPIEGIPLKVGHNYSRKPEEYPENEVVNLASVDYDEPSCIWCLNCVEVCPTGAIDVNTLAINNGLCIRCFACARACPTKARKAAVIKDVINYFKTILDKRQEPSIII